MEPDTSKNPVILFDGVCNLCNSSVDFVVSRDPERHFRYASLQSEVGQNFIKKFGIDPSKMDSILLVQNGRYFYKSTAALKIAAKLRGPVKAVAVLRVVPAFFRDVVYDFIARNRYRWFGKKETCRLPTPEERGLFLG